MRARQRNHVGVCARSTCLLSLLGQTEVENLDMAIFGNKDIFWLQVAMNDASLVCGSQALRDLNSIFDGFALRKRAPAERVA